MISFLLLATTLTKPDAVDEIVDKAMKDMKIPGAAILVARDGKPVKMKGYGLANLEHQVPVKNETLFQSGSVGKQFTATGVMVLVEEGKLKLDDSIGKHFPEAKGAWDKVTVRHLLSHTSGLGQLPYHEMNLWKDHSEDDLVKAMTEQKVVSEPGEKFAYNNGGYVLLGILTHRVSGKFYGDFLKEKVFGPLGMTTAQVISEQAITPNRAGGYEYFNGKIQNQRWVAPTTNTTADGALYLSLNDYLKWDAGLYGSKILKQSTLASMWSPTKLNDGKFSNYGLGWFNNTIDGHRLVDHSGAWQGFTTYIGRCIDQKLTVVVLTNLDGRSSRPTIIGQSILRSYLPAKAKN